MYCSTNPITTGSAETLVGVVQPATHFPEAPHYAASTLTCQELPPGELVPQSSLHGHPTTCPPWMLGQGGCSLPAADALQLCSRSRSCVLPRTCTITQAVSGSMKNVLGLAVGMQSIGLYASSGITT